MSTHQPDTAPAWAATALAAVLRRAADTHATVGERFPPYGPGAGQFTDVTAEMWTIRRHRRNDGT